MSNGIEKLTDKITSDWNYKYRPKTIEELACDTETKSFLEKIIAQQDFPNILMCSNTGMGKNSIVNIIKNNIDFAYLEINCSSNTGIDTVRDSIIEFAETKSLKKKKCVILNEFCGTTYQAQQSLKEVMEDNINNCSFIITANNRQKINEAIIGRCVEITLNPPKSEIKRRLKEIFDSENVNYDDEYIDVLIKKNNTNIRKMVNESYKLYKSYGNLKAEYITSSTIDEKTREYFENVLATKDIKRINELTKSFIFDDDVYNMLKDYVCETYNNPNLIIPISEYAYRSRIMVGHNDLCLMSCLMEIRILINGD